MKIQNNVWILLTFPIIADLVEWTPRELTPTISIICLVAWFIRSTAYATNSYAKATLKFKNIIAIYSTGLFLSYLVFEAALYYESMTIAGAGSALVSYFSIDVIIGISAIIKALPKIALKVIESYSKK